jgi:hypothetical protein
MTLLTDVTLNTQRVKIKSENIGVVYSHRLHNTGYVLTSVRKGMSGLAFSRRYVLGVTRTGGNVPNFRSVSLPPCSRRRSSWPSLCTFSIKEDYTLKKEKAGISETSCPSTMLHSITLNNTAILTSTANIFELCLRNERQYVR